MSPIICDAKFMREFLEKIKNQFPPPFSYVDKYTLEGLDVYEEWLEEQKKFVEIKRLARKAYIDQYNFSDTDDGDF